MSRKNTAVQKTHQNSINSSRLTVVEGEVRLAEDISHSHYHKTKSPFSVVHNVLLMLLPSPETFSCFLYVSHEDVWCVSKAMLQAQTHKSSSKSSKKSFFPLVFGAPVVSFLSRETSSSSDQGMRLKIHIIKWRASRGETMLYDNGDRDGATNSE